MSKSKPTKKQMKTLVKQQPKMTPEELVQDHFQRSLKEAGGDPERAQLGGPTKPKDEWKQMEMGKQIKGKPRTDIINQLSTAVTHAVQRWGVDYVIADVKYRGVRALLVIDPEAGTVNVISRKYKENYAQSFGDKFADQIIDDLNTSFTTEEPIIVDAELWAQLDDQFLPQKKVTGFVTAPNSPEYKDFTPWIEAFDIYMLLGHDLRDLPQIMRKHVLEEAISEQDTILRDADLELLAPTHSAIDEKFREVLAEGHEGLVVKHPDSKVFVGKQSKWLKLKGSETVDLELRGATKYPRGDKPFKFFKHLELVPSDTEENTVDAVLGVTGAGIDWKWSIDLTQRLLAMIDRGEAVAKGKLVDVSTDSYRGKTFRQWYGRDQVPTSVEIPKGGRPIIEIYTEDISLDEQTGKYAFPGVKIVGLREDKGVGDTLADIEQIRKIFYEPTGEIEAPPETPPPQPAGHGGVPITAIPRKPFASIQGMKPTGRAIYIKVKDLE
jgi:hypothetical protein